ncbi:zinc finger SWIM domain-containing protein 7-like [Phlebotomus argentipes]|uniref:zinc finger SWIM domain-containing protein 7-like n=1 Tax=Phlebotomus argentipes TaxID=94469 RepID=UPI002893734C|nr:zinc finger SWIM domain-containing protein 7-like [Phlebotomus argentipes]
MNSSVCVSRKQHISLADASTILFKLRDNIFREFDKEYEKKSGFPTHFPAKEFRELEIIYGNSVQKAIDILKEKRVQRCTECPGEFQQFKIKGGQGNFYHLAENSLICRCPAFKRLFYANATHFQCKHILAIQLMKYFDSSFTPSAKKKY